MCIRDRYSGDLLVQTKQWLFVALLGGWIPSSITDFQYDDNDLLIDQLTSAVDFTTGDIVPSARTTFAYNAEGLQETVIDYTWVDPNWEESFRTTFEYYSNGTLSNEVEEVFSNGTWVNSTWTTYPVENVTDEYPFSSYIWDAVGSTWVISDSTINLLNPSLPWAQVAAPTPVSYTHLDVYKRQGFYLRDLQPVQKIRGDILHHHHQNSARDSCYLQTH